MDFTNELVNYNFLFASLSKGRRASGYRVQRTTYFSDVSGLKKFYTSFRSRTSADRPSRPFVSRGNISQSSEIFESRTRRWRNGEGLSQRRVRSRHIFLRTLSFPARTHPRPRNSIVTSERAD